MKINANTRMLQEVAKAFGPLKDKMIFVGGATTALYIDDTGAPSPTPSDDIDCVVEVASPQEYARLEEKLRKLGFKHPPMDPDDPAPICRKILDGIKVDIMPTEESILGFSNRWYPEAIAHKLSMKLPDGQAIYIFSAAYFLATKLVAYQSRSRDQGEDIRGSQDIEDICAVLDGCSYLEKNVDSATDQLKQFIRKALLELLEDDQLLEEAARGFLRPGIDPVARAQHLVQRARRIAIPF